MIAGLDSSFDRPTAGIAAQARAAGVRLWSGYLATRPNVGLAAPWSRSNFDAARQCGATPIAFASGWDDPVALKAMAADWGVRLCLDVEDAGLRDDGPWVDGWLAASGAGLYGRNSPLGSIHYHAAPFHVGSYYPGFDPGSSWFGARPADGSPCGWQWQGSHIEFGLSVDRGWYDDWFLEDTPVTGNEKLAFVRLAYGAFLWRVPSPDEQSSWAAQIADDGSNLDAIMANIEDSSEGDQLKTLRSNLLTWAAARAFPGQPGPPGPPGPAGPPVDTSKFAKADHLHDVTVSGTTGRPK